MYTNTLTTSLNHTLNTLAATDYLQMYLALILLARALSSPAHAFVENTGIDSLTSGLTLCNFLQGRECSVDQGVDINHKGIVLYVFQS